MTLFGATIITGLILIALGGLFLSNPKFLKDQAQGLLRSNKASLVLFGGATIWFLWHISQLRAADFGGYKHLLMLLFGVIAVGSFFYVKDFLAVRGLGSLFLLSSQPLLDAAYMQELKSRLILVIFAYILIIAGLYIGTVPFKVRDFFNWLFGSRVRLKVFGGCLGLYGAILAIVAFTY